VGWVPFEPTPEELSDLAAPEPPVNTTAAAAVAASAGEELTDPPVEEPPPLEVDDADVSTLLLVVLAVIGLVVAYLLVVALARAFVRARRRRGPPGHKVLGAWAHARAALARNGTPVSEATTAAEAAEQRSRPATAPGAATPPDGATSDGASSLSATSDGATSDGAPPGGPEDGPLDRLAPLVAVAVYHPAGATEDHATAAWEAADALEGELRREQGLAKRATALISPPLPHGAGGRIWRSGARLSRGGALAGRRPAAARRPVTNGKQVGR
jgi:hypothetical protein